MQLQSLKQKKSVMNQVIGVFILVLVISVIAGMTFLFVSQLKTTSGDLSASRSIENIINETLTTVTETGEDFAYVDYNDALCSSLVVTNASGGEVISSGNYTQTNCNLASSATGGYNNTNWNVSYSVNYIDGTGWSAINSTEAAGADIIDYLPLLFLAIIFGAILMVVLKVLLPYINLGGQMNMGF